MEDPNTAPSAAAESEEHSALGAILIGLGGACLTVLGAAGAVEGLSPGLDFESLVFILYLVSGLATLYSAVRCARGKGARKACIALGVINPILPLLLIAHVNNTTGNLHGTECSMLVVVVVAPASLFGVFRLLWRKSG